MFYAQLEIFSTLNTDKVAVKRLGVRAGPDNCKSESGFIASSEPAARKQSFKIDFGWDYCGALLPRHR